jgi:hypothetical protein
MLDEALCPRSRHDVFQAMHAMQQLARRHGGHRDRILVVLTAELLQIKLSPLRSDQHAGVDQRAHGLRRVRSGSTNAWRRTQIRARLGAHTSPTADGRGVTKANREAIPGSPIPTRTRLDFHPLMQRNDIL